MWRGAQVLQRLIIVIGCRGACAVKAKVQRRCRIEYMNMSKAGAEVQRCRGAEVQRGRGSERQRVREEMQRRSIGVVGVEMWRCRCAEVQRSREVQRGPKWRCRDAA